LLAEPKEKLRIKGGFGVTGAAKARVRALRRAASSGFRYPLSYHLTPKPLTKAWRITVDAGEKEVDHNNALSAARLQVEGPAMGHCSVGENHLPALIT
jgi:hypothetical protein